MRPAVFKQHPRDLRFWLFSEFSERLCYFTIKALLAVVMIHSFGANESQTVFTLAMFSSYCYLTPLVGGFISDRWLSAEQAVILGSLLMVIGYLVLGLPKDHDLVLGLAIVATGMGFYKTNIILCISRLYSPEDQRRGEAFTLICAVIDLSLLITTGLLTWTATYSWRITFIGLSGLLLVSTGLLFSKLRSSSSFQLRSLLSTKPLLAGLSASAQIILLALLLSAPEKSHPLLWLIFAAILAYYAYIIYHCQKVDRPAFLIIFSFSALGVIFFSFVGQIDFSILFYIDTHISRTFMGYIIPSPFFMVLEPIGFIALCPMISAVLLKQQPIDRKHFVLVKFSISFACLALAFGLLAFVTYPLHSAGSYWSIGLIIFFIASAEVFFLPSLLELPTQFGSEKIVNLTMALPFLSFAFSSDLAGYISQLSLISTDIVDHGQTAIKHNYFNLFLGISIVSIIISLFLAGIKLYANRQKWPL